MDRNGCVGGWLVCGHDEFCYTLYELWGLRYEALCVKYTGTVQCGRFGAQKQCPDHRNVLTALTVLSSFKHVQL